VNGSLIDLAGLQVGAEDFLAAVLDSVAQPVWVVDPKGVIRFANPAAIAALGYDGADELLGRNSHETIHHSRPDGSHYPAADCPMLLPRTTGETVARDLDWFFRRPGFFTDGDHQDHIHIAFKQAIDPKWKPPPAS
jgi:PAS domain-containing protein